MNIGEVYMLDNSFHQCPSFQVYKIKDLFSDKAVIEQIIYVGKRDPHNGNSNFDIYTADTNFAVIRNAKPLDEKLAIQRVFYRLWDIHDE